MQTSDGLAIISVDGTLVYKSSWLGAWSGMMSYSDIGATFQAAVDDSSVSGILLMVDSNGGEVNGAFDLSDAIYGARQAKPVYAVAADDAFSAAYALAASAEKLFVSRTSGVGSIGVVALHVDQSAYDKMEGVKYTYVYAGAHKVDGNPHQPLSATAKDSIQAECDRMQALFAGSVARYRGMSADALIGLEASCYYGDQAIAVGLADQVGTPGDALTALRAAVAARSASAPGGNGGNLVLAGGAPNEGKIVDLAKVRSEGAAAESRRMLEIAELCTLAERPALTREMQASGMTAEEVRKHLQALRASTSDAIRISSHAGLDVGTSENATAAWDHVLTKYGFVKKP